jgi:hypothetical protein
MAAAVPVAMLPGRWRPGPAFMASIPAVSGHEPAVRYGLALQLHIDRNSG